MTVARRRTTAFLLLLARLKRWDREHWVNPLKQRRPKRGDFFHLVADLDSQCHHNYFLMSAEQKDKLLSVTGSDLVRPNANYGAAIEQKQRLTVGLRGTDIIHNEVLNTMCLTDYLQN